MLVLGVNDVVSEMNINVDVHVEKLVTKLLLSWTNVHDIKVHFYYCRDDKFCTNFQLDQ